MQWVGAGLGAIVLVSLGVLTAMLVKGRPAPQQSTPAVPVGKVAAAAPVLPAPVATENHADTVRVQITAVDPLFATSAILIPVPAPMQQAQLPGPRLEKVAARSDSPIAAPIELEERPAVEFAERPVGTAGAVPRDMVPVSEPAMPFPPVEAARAAAAVVTPPPAVTTIRTDPREPVRGIIERYRTAYERLDAAAARSVWPGVDAAALERAFGSLQSQELDFEDCAINVGQGVADATCRGRALVVPKVGGGTQSVRRTWNFSLRQTGEAWRIEKASVK